MRLRESPVVLLAVCFVMSVGANAYSISPASITPLLMTEYGVDKFVAGLAISVFVLGVMTAQIPSGVVMDRRDNRVLAAVASVVLLAAAIVGATVQSLPGLLVPRVIAGFAFPFLFIMLTKLVSAAFSERRRGMATSLFTASAPTGLALGQFATPILVSWDGLSAAFIAYPLVTLLATGLFVFVAPSGADDAGDPLSLSALKDTLLYRPLVFVSLSGTCGYAVYFFLNSWIPTYAAEQLSFPLAEAGTIAALVPIMGILARPGGGWLSDRIGARRRPIVIASLAVAVPAFFVIVVAPSIRVFAALLLFVGFAVQFSMGVYFVLATELSPPGATGTGLALFGAISFAGSFVAPAVGGLLIDVFSWGTAFAVFGAIGLLGIVLILPVTRGDRLDSGVDGGEDRPA